MKRTIATLVLSASIIGSAQAYTPSSGFWYNPTESGTGIAIEIEDKLLFMAAYVYDTQGRLRVYYRYGSGAEALAHDVKQLLKEAR